MINAVDVVSIDAPCPPATERYAAREEEQKTYIVFCSSFLSYARINGLVQRRRGPPSLCAILGAITHRSMLTLVHTLTLESARR
jgi:hypothetical protein